MLDLPNNSVKYKSVFSVIINAFCDLNLCRYPIERLCNLNCDCLDEKSFFIQAIILFQTIRRLNLKGGSLFSDIFLHKNAIRLLLT